MVRTILLPPETRSVLTSRDGEGFRWPGHLHPGLYPRPGRGGSRTTGTTGRRPRRRSRRCARRDWRGASPMSRAQRRERRVGLRPARSCPIVVQVYPRPKSRPCREPPMRQIAACLILVALFILLVGSRFRPSDGDKLAAVSRLAVTKVREALPPAERVSAPVNALRRELPQRTEGGVRARLEADKLLAGVGFAVSADGGAVKLRGIVPNTAARQR